RKIRPAEVHARSNAIDQVEVSIAVEITPVHSATAGVQCDDQLGRKILHAETESAGTEAPHRFFNPRSPPKWWVAMVLHMARAEAPLRFRRPLHHCNACNPNATR